MAYKVIKPKNHDEWLEHRGKGIGSSEVATILGFNPYQTKLELYNRKLGITPPIEENQLMKLGHYNEDAVAKCFRDATGAEIVKSSAGDWLAVDVDEPFLRCSPDRIYYKKGAKHNEANKCILECKTTQNSVDPDNPPFYWFCQLQYQMGIMGVKEGELAWIIKGRDFGHKHYYFDPMFYEQMKESIREFIINHLDTQIPPQAETANDVRSLYPKEYIGKVIDGKVVICVNPDDDVEVHKNYSLMQVLREVKAINEKMSELKSRKDMLVDAIQLKMKDAEAVVIDDNGKQIILATWKKAKDSVKFNSKKFEKENPELCIPYMETSIGSRRFLVK